MAATCPVKGLRLQSKGARTVNVTNTLLPFGGHSFLQALLHFNGAAHQLSDLIDSGAEGDFMDTELAARLLHLFHWLSPFQPELSLSPSRAIMLKRFIFSLFTLPPRRLTMT